MHNSSVSTDNIWTLSGLDVETFRKNYRGVSLNQLGWSVCLWPHLHWCTSMCETHIRHQDDTRICWRSRRFQESYSSRSSFSNTSSEDDQRGAHLAGGTSLKKSFMAKARSPSTGCGTQYELCQFLFDLWLWSTVGSEKEAATVPLRLALGGKPYSLDIGDVK